MFGITLRIVADDNKHYLYHKEDRGFMEVER